MIPSEYPIGSLKENPMECSFTIPVECTIDCRVEYCIDNGFMRVNQEQNALHFTCYVPNEQINNNSL